MERRFSSPDGYASFFTSNTKSTSSNDDFEDASEWTPPMSPLVLNLSSKINKTLKKTLFLEDDDPKEDFDFIKPLNSSPPILNEELEAEEKASIKAAKAYYDSHRRSSLTEALALLQMSEYSSKQGGSDDDEVIDTEQIWDIPIQSRRHDNMVDYSRSVMIRRKLLGFAAPDIKEALEDLPYENLDYSKVIGVCCENVVGYVPVPLGYAGPLTLDDVRYIVPMATTEGCLVASTNRGCRALTNGVISHVYSDGMSRNPIARFSNSMRAIDVYNWIKDSTNFRVIQEIFAGDSEVVKLTKVTAKPAGRFLYFRFLAMTGDDVGIFLMSKGTQMSMEFIKKFFPDMEILTCGGTNCADEKLTAVNWIEGSGRSVVVESIVSANVLKSVLKVTAEGMRDLHISKNLVGSTVAGSIGGFNAHAANVVTAIFIATGQDTSQVVTSSCCLTMMETCGPDNEDLHVSVTMPTMECGTTGGGTTLPCQKSCLEMLGIDGPNVYLPGNNARNLAAVIAGAVLAGELSLMAALVSGQLVAAHMKHNRVPNGLQSSA